MLDTIFSNYIKEIVATLIVIIIFGISRAILKTLTNKFGEKSGFTKPRISVLLKYIDIFLTSILIILLITIWGVEGRQAFLFISSIFTVIGVAMFAQWSILSNITAGVLLFFYFPFKIGNTIKILDKEIPIEAEIIDIKSFYTLLKTKEGEIISYPNNLLLQKSIAIIN